MRHALVLLLITSTSAVLTPFESRLPLTCGSTNKLGIGGHDIGQHTGVPTASACCDACAAVANCKAAVWIAGDTSCYFKDATAPTQPAADGSWVVICGGAPGPTPPTPTPPTPSGPPSGPTPAPTFDPSGPGGQWAAWGVWPEPKSFTWTNTNNASMVTVSLSANFTIGCTMSSGSCPSDLTAAIARYRKIIFRAGPPSRRSFLTNAEVRKTHIAGLRRARMRERDAKRAPPRRTPFGLVPGDTFASLLEEDAIAMEIDAYTGRSSASSSASSPLAPRAQSALTVLDILITGTGAEPLTIGVDESYSLRVGGAHDPPRATITANTQWGAMRGLETFAQTILCHTSNSAKESSQVNNGTTAACVYTIQNAPLAIDDEPRFKWRGLMLDTARHFIPIEGMKRMIDAMCANKMNVLHWHATDDTSWSIESELFPNFSALGAYSSEQVFTTAMQDDLDTYAKERGVIIYPEFDVPSHAGIWGSTYPEYTSPWNLPPNPRPGAIIEPTGVSGIFDALDNLTTEIARNGMVHFGGDEVGDRVSAWNNDVRVLKWAKEQGSPFVNSSGGLDYDLIHLNFELTLAENAVKLGKTPVFWQEAWMNGVGANTTVSTLKKAFAKESVFAFWSGAVDGAAVRNGYRVLSNDGWYVVALMSHRIRSCSSLFIHPHDCSNSLFSLFVFFPSFSLSLSNDRYLDQSNPGGPLQYAWQDYWSNFWGKEPCYGANPPLTNDECEKFVLGGEVSMWSERIDVTNLDQIWPRISGAAERLWTPISPPDLTNENQHYAASGQQQHRLMNFRCKMVVRGIAAGPVYTQDQTNYDDGNCALPTDYSPLRSM